MRHPKIGEPNPKYTRQTGRLRPLLSASAYNNAGITDSFLLTTPSESPNGVKWLFALPLAAQFKIQRPVIKLSERGTQWLILCRPSTNPIDQRE